VLENPLTRRVHEAAACAAFSLTQGDGDAFAVFAAKVKQGNLSVGGADGVAGSFDLRLST
jgi:hypothetical protein